MCTGASMQPAADMTHCNPEISLDNERGLLSCAAIRKQFFVIKHILILIIVILCKNLILNFY
jgi:hypothetical protein